MAIFKRMADEKAATQPSKSTRGQLKETTETKEDVKVAGPMKATEGPTSSSFTVLIDDCGETMTAKGHADDGSDESIVSSRVAERAVLNGIGKLTRIAPVTLQVALKTGSDAEMFTLSRTWAPLQTVF